MSYQNRQNFEPSTATRNAWYKTRKQTTSYGPTHLPGLFGTNDSSSDTVWFFLALLIEFAAVFITIWSGLSRGFGIAVGATIVVILFIVLDYVGILFHSDLSARRTVWRNEILIQQTPQYLAELRGKIANRTLKEDVGVLFLFLSAFLKVFAIVLLNAMFTHPSMIMVFTIFYLIVIYIHANHTGYWLADFNFKRNTIRDYKQWSMGNGNNAQIYIHNFQTPYNLQMKVGDVRNVNCQTLTCQSLSNGIYSFQLTSVGLMWDQDIATLCMGLLHHEKPILALECLQLQLTQTVASGNTQNGTSNSSSNANNNVNPVN